MKNAITINGKTHVLVKNTDEKLCWCQECSLEKYCKKDFSKNNLFFICETLFRKENHHFEIK